MYANIHVELAKHGRMTQKQLAQDAGIHEKTLGMKLNGKTDFTLSEMRKIQVVLGNATLDYLFDTGKSA